jgi:hypothetical protein
MTLLWLLFVQVAERNVAIHGDPYPFIPDLSISILHVIGALLPARTAQGAVTGVSLPHKAYIAIISSTHGER